MLVTSAPSVLPISTANLPTEAVAKENAQKFPIPEPKSALENPATRQATENSQPKNLIDANQSEKNKSRDDAQDSTNQSKSDDNGAQQDKATAKEENLKRQQIEKLRQTDRKVRAHEKAHANVGGKLAGTPQYRYEVGPDGKKYAVSGEVDIDLTRVANDPQATIDKLQQVRQAALAPANPSAQDLRVAARASQMVNQALTELAVQRNQQVQLQQKSQQNKENNSIESENNASDKANSAKKSSLSLQQKITSTGALRSLPPNGIFIEISI